MAHIITFDNHSPIRIADKDMIRTVWSSGQDFGHHDLDAYTTRRGRTIYWISENSGRSYGGHDPKTHRIYMRSIADIRAHFVESTYHAEVEENVDEASIIDVDALA